MKQKLAMMAQTLSAKGLLPGTAVPSETPDPPPFPIISKPGTGFVRRIAGKNK